MRLLGMTKPALLTLLFTASMLAQAQRPGLPHAGTPQPYDPRTFDPGYESKMTIFLAKKDLLITQTHYPVQTFETGKGQRLRVEGVVASSAANHTTLKAVRLSPAATPAGSAQIDLDEAEIFSQALAAFITTAEQWLQSAPGNHTELSFNGHEGLLAELTWTRSTTSVSLRLNDFSETRVNMDLNDLQRFKQAMDAAIALLQTR